LTGCDGTYTLGHARSHAIFADSVDRSVYRRRPGGGDPVLDSIIPRQPCIAIGSHVDRAGAGSGPPDDPALGRTGPLADAGPDCVTSDSFRACPEILISTNDSSIRPSLYSFRLIQQPVVQN